MIEELRVKIRGVEYTRTHVLVEGEKPNGDRIVLKFSKSDIDFINSKFID
jgi:hypothetical protein